MRNVYYDVRVFPYRVSTWQTEIDANRTPKIAAENGRQTHYNERRCSKNAFKDTIWYTFVTNNTINSKIENHFTRSFVLSSVCGVIVRECSCIAGALVLTLCAQQHPLMILLVGSHAPSLQLLRLGGCGLCGC